MLLIEKIFLIFVVVFEFSGSMQKVLDSYITTSNNRELKSKKMQEIWKDVVNYEGLYQVSNFGNVRSLDRNRHNAHGWYISKGRILKPCKNSRGYLLVVLSENTNRFSVHVHSLVAVAFLGHKPNGLKGLVVNHKDFNKKNNNLYNLELVTTRTNSNQKHLKSTSKYTGVSWRKRDKKWESQIHINGKVIYLGYFTDEIEASKYYENALLAIKNNTEIKVKRPKFSSKYKGVSFYKSRNRWIAKITINGKKIHLGSFKEEICAYKARLDYETKLKD